MEVEELKSVASYNIVSVLEHYIPNGSWRGVEYYFLNPSRPDKHTSSCSFNKNKMMYKDFASGDGGDIISYVQLALNCDFKTAIEDLKNYLGHADIKQDKPNEAKAEITIIKPEFEPKNFNHYKHGKPSQVWEHKYQDGSIFGYICRFLMQDKSKLDLPYYFASVKDKNGNTTKKWVYKAPSPKDRILVGLDTLERKSKSIFVVEGQKCQSKLAGFIKVPVVTWTQGANSVHLSQWEQVKNDGRDIIFWQDNDTAGFEVIAKLQEILQKNIYIMNIPKDKPNKWDCADFIDGGCTPKELVDFIQTNKRLYTLPVDLIEDLEEIETLGPTEDIEPIEEIETLGPTEDIEPIEENNTANNPFVCLGYDHEKYYYFVTGLQQVRSYASTGHSSTNLIELAELSYWESMYPAKSGVDWQSALNSLFRQQAQKGVYNPSNLRGRGVWLDNKKIVVHNGDFLIVNQKKMAIKSFKSKYTYEKNKSLDIKANSDLIDLESTQKLFSAIGKLSWEKSISAKLLAGWIVIAPISGCLKWRPHIWLTAGAGIGKSWVLQNIIRPLIGEHISALGESTQAGLRQETKNDSLPVVIDEFESNDVKGLERITGILELARQSSSDTDSTIFKGSLSHKSVSFNPRCIYCFASIGLGIKEFADQTRVAVLKLIKNKDKEEFKKIEKDFYSIINEDFKYKLINKTIKNIDILFENEKLFNNFLAKEMSKRMADQYAILFAGAWSLQSEKVILENEIASFVENITEDDLKDLNFDNDEARCLELILESKIRVFNKDYTIAEAVKTIFDYCNEAKMSIYNAENENKILAEEFYDTLMRNGIRVDVGRSWKENGDCNKAIIIAGQHKEIDKMLEKTAYANKHKHYLERLPNVVKNINTRFAGNVKRGTKIPMEEL